MRTQPSSARGAGRSFLSAPISDTALAPFSPLVTVRADRSAPAYTAVQWDDDGVVPVPATLIEAGHVRGYLTTRETARLLQPGTPSGGYASAPQPAALPMTGGAHLTLTPAASRATIDDLLREIVHGLLIDGGPRWTVKTGH